MMASLLILCFATSSSFRVEQPMDPSHAPALHHGSMGFHQETATTMEVGSGWKWTAC